MRTLSFVALALSTALAQPAVAQYRPGAPSVQPLTAADQLAAVMRRVAAAPTDVFALVSAGELSIKLDDMSAAAAFFARAEKIDPRNGRVKAGMAAILVRAERPGEALRYFQMAEGLGHPASRFASDRGLAFDLLGEQERAQRDYRLALRTAADDETVRRYALSLGISGRQALALEQLEPLTRRQDRASWRVRAFVLAMNGDVAGASTIATTMMPRGMAGGLQPFFERLPSLPAADRAFAVHFGEVRPTPARLADARMKPGLAPLGPDPFPPVQVAVARPATPPVALASRQDRRRGRARVERNAARPVERRAVASAVPRVAPAPDRRVVASASTRVPIPVARRREPVAVASDAIDAPASAALQALAQSGGTGQASPAVTPAQVASAAPVQPSFGSVPNAVGRTAAPQSVAPVASAPVQLAGTLPPPVPTPIRIASETSSPASPPTVPATLAADLPTATTLPSARPTVNLASPGPSVQRPTFGEGQGGTVQVALAPSVTAPAALATGAVDPGVTSPGFASLAPPSVPAAITTSAPVEVAVAPTSAPVTAVRSEDSILARIVASITIPGEELGVVQPERRATTPAVIEPATARVLAAGEAEAASQTADRAAAARTIASVAKASTAGSASSTRRGRRAAAEQAEEAEPAARTRRGGRTELAAREEAEATAKPRTSAEKRLADRKKAADDRAALAKADKAKIKGEPERIWVQVAGGASEGDLPKAWGAAQKKAAALKGRVAYTTPLRATNRVVTGPFKTAAEARAFVNQLARQGVSAFQFVSVTGQKMTKLSPK